MVVGFTRINGQAQRQGQTARAVAMLPQPARGTCFSGTLRNRQAAALPQCTHWQTSAWVIRCVCDTHITRRLQKHQAQPGDCSCTCACACRQHALTTSVTRKLQSGTPVTTKPAAAAACNQQICRPLLVLTMMASHGSPALTNGFASYVG
jgi:hypothetical protein